jgi:hypothetical protein
MLAALEANTAFDSDTTRPGENKVYDRSGNVDSSTVEGTTSTMSAPLESTGLLSGECSIVIPPLMLGPGGRDSIADEK